MNTRLNEKRVFTKRAFMFAVIEVILCLIVLLRLCYLQIFNSQHYALLSDKNRLVASLVLPNRGNILDSTGQVLANNRISYSAVLDLFAIPEAMRDEVVSQLILTLGIDKKTTPALFDVPKNVNRTNRFILLQEDIDWSTLSRYYIISSKLPGIVIERSQARNYLEPEEFSHVIGYVGAPTKDDLINSENAALSLPTAKIGKTCIEKTYNDNLFGTSGIKHVEVNSLRQFVRNIDSIDAIPGENLVITVNANLQREVYELLSQHESASCVVMDVSSGAVLAFVSYPGYDPNIFTKKIAKNTLKELYDNPYKPMINKVVSGLYSPGSAFKMITALAGLKKGVINEHTRFICQGHYELGNHKFHCWRWKYGGHGSVNLQEALAQSCDVYFYNVARLVSPDDIAAVALDFGLGTKTNIDLPNEKSGLVPTKAWKKKNKKQSWTTGDTLNMAIGQGFVLATPIQLAKMISMLANGMKPVTPHIVGKAEMLEEAQNLNYDPKHLRIILDGLYDVVNSPSGTARSSAIEDPSFELCGKTGSSQVFHITTQQRSLGQTVSDDYWKKEHAVFVGFAPAESPKIAVVVLVEHGGGGARTAAPIARDVLLAARKHLKL